MAKSLNPDQPAPRGDAADRAEFFERLDAAIADADAGRVVDADVVFARLDRRYRDWSTAAE